MEVKAGQVLNLTEGDYSDYRIVATVDVLKTFDPKEKKLEFKETCPEEFIPYKTPQRDGRVGWHRRPTYNTSNYVAWLETNGFVKESDDAEFNFDYD